jgi:CrcB protein
MLQSFAHAGPQSAGLRLALTTGAMGGFTTYSTFNYETLNLLSSGRWLAGGGYLLITVLGCLLGGLVGMSAGRVFAS